MKPVNASRSDVVRDSSTCSLAFVMSGEYDDVLTNQPVVIDNVSVLQPLSMAYSLAFFEGIRHNKGWLRRTRSSEMLLSVFVRPHG